MPVFTASTPISDTTASIWSLITSIGTSATAVTPNVFCAVIAVTALVPNTPNAANVFKIRLNARSPSGIGPGDGQGTRWRCGVHFHIEYASGMTDAHENDLTQVKALIFDVFGTVVNWRDSIIARGLPSRRAHGMSEGDWGRFADEWRAWYGKSTRELSRGDGPWRLVDEIHREKLDILLAEYGLADVMSEQAKVDLNRAWHRLDGWPDSPSGLRRLKSKFIIATASNGNLALLVNMAKHADLPWDAVMSPDVYGAYKPSPKVYQNASKLLGLDTNQVMMVAAHTGDLEAFCAPRISYRVRVPTLRAGRTTRWRCLIPQRSIYRRPISTIWQTSWVATDPSYIYIQRRKQPLKETRLCLGHSKTPRQ